MSREYSPKEIEKKWQDIWDNEEAFKATLDKSKPKYYALVEFPYPSGQGLHVGHPRPYTAMDIVSRKKRMQGYNVLFPMGWDAFGLPTENYAIKNKIHPKIVTKNNVAHFKDQLKSLGYSFDWSREINTTDPSYYKWTQWIFLQLFKKGLAYKSEMPINWCTSCKVGLANEEVVNGVCERCGAPVIRKMQSQWMLKITDYAEKLIEGLDHVDYIEKVKVSQKNWIGRSEGAEVNFKLSGKDEALTVYTTRPDTLFGATYMVISPEHPMIDKYKDEISNYDEILAYRAQAARKSDFERTELAKDKTGACIKGITAVNPVNGKEIPIWVSDYVLMSYGTGAVIRALAVLKGQRCEFLILAGIQRNCHIRQGVILEGAAAEAGILIYGQQIIGVDTCELGVFHDKIFAAIGTDGRRGLCVGVSQIPDGAARDLAVLYIAQIDTDAGAAIDIAGANIQLLTLVGVDADEAAAKEPQILQQHILAVAQVNDVSLTALGLHGMSGGKAP